LQEIGIISDLDKTVIPASTANLPEQAYPGVAALFHELEFGKGGKAGDTYYVTARTPDRIEGVADWLQSQGLPTGSIDTGTSTLPWVAEPEKVADITRVLDANPQQTFMLFGDTSHRDPEVYRNIRASRPERVNTVFMHKVNQVNPDRVDGMFVFENYTEVAAELLRLGVFDDTQARRVMVSAQLQGQDITDAQIEALIESHRP
jgi:phosphatidate phosphatase APP1